jgi:predicted RNA-binding Zn-ribbon protein involved in translation (DUF1610 family)
MPSTYNGFGTKFYGEAEHHPDGSFITTEWITALYVPLIPLRSYRLARARSENPFENALMCETFAIFEELPIFWSQVLRVYGFFLCTGIWYAISIWLFFSKFSLHDLFLSNRIEATLLLCMFIATLAIPLVIVWSIRRRSMLKVGVTPPEFGDNIVKGKKLRPAQKVFAVVTGLIFILPPIIVCELNLPPASWLSTRQSSWFVPYREWRIIMLCFGWFVVLAIPLLLLSSIVKMLTGKRPGQLFSNGSAKESEKSEPFPTTAAAQTRTAAPQTGRKEVLITHCHMCACPIEPEQQGTLKTCPGCGADLSRQRRYAKT